jgi:hypothetical protein
MTRRHIHPHRGAMPASSWLSSLRDENAGCSLPIRDAMLAICGQLDLRLPLGSPIVEQGNGPIGQFKQYPSAGVPEDVLVEAGSRTTARSVYLPIARELLPDALAVFDFAEPGFVTGSRETTNVPWQALYMLNSPFIASAAQKFAERVITTYPESTTNTDAGRIQFAYGLVFSRSPSEAEQQAASDFFAKFPGANASATTAWTSLCRALFASAEFRFLN